MSNVTYEPHVHHSEKNRKEGYGYKGHVQISRNGHKIEWIDAQTAVATEHPPLVQAGNDAINAADLLNQQQGMVTPPDNYATLTQLVIRPSYVGNLPLTTPASQLRAVGFQAAKPNVTLKPAKPKATKKPTNNNIVQEQQEALAAMRAEIAALKEQTQAQVYQQVQPPTAPVVQPVVENAPLQYVQGIDPRMSPLAQQLAAARELRAARDRAAGTGTY